MTASITLLVVVFGVLYGCYRIGRIVERRRIAREMRDLPITDKQRAFIVSLCRERGHDIPDFDGMTRSVASLLIDDLKSRTAPDIKLTGPAA